MRNRYHIREYAIAGILVFAVAMICAPILHAQVLTEGNVELGGRLQDGSQDSSKYTEYREVPSGLFVDSIYLGVENSEHTYFFNLWGSHVAQEDQNLLVQFGLRGKYKIEFEWDEIPHNFTNTARSLFNETGKGVFEIPASVRSTLETLLSTDADSGTAGVQPDFPELDSAIHRLAHDIEMISKRAKGKGAFTYTPNAQWQFSLQYGNEKRSGRKPFGANFGFAPIELIEPTEYQTQEVRAGVEYFGKNWNAQLGYFLSVFENDVDVLVWDNPFVENDGTSTSARGRIDLYPDNTAQKIHFSGAANLPFSTRLMATISHGWRRQNDSFIPLTINTMLDTSAVALPADSLNGEVDTTRLNISVTNRFFSSVGFTARFRYYDYDNQTPSLTFPGYVRTDERVVLTQRRNVANDYRKINSSVDANVRLMKDVSFKVGYNREQWYRRYREAAETDENTYRASLDYTPHASWLLVRTSYAFAEKKTQGYDRKRVAYEGFPSGDPGIGQLPQLRKFDMASRQRNKANLLAQITPFDTLSFTSSLGLAFDDFDESEYGMRTNNSYDFSVDAAFNPTPDLALFASATWENFDYEMQSRQRRTGNDSPNSDWISDMEDKAITIGASMSWAAIPEKV
ncbi:MAG: MtrB/PioB family decaheme-associated outer membrane protein, partial [Desulfobacterales bacterium]